MLVVGFKNWCLNVKQHKSDQGFLLSHYLNDAMKCDLELLSGNLTLN